MAIAQSIPGDAQSSCVVAPSVFAGWFTSGTVTANGSVNPADSLNFPNTPNCSFYQWSEQMFLWLTSPAPITYGGGGGRVFDSSVFFDVSAPDPTDSSRTLNRLGGGRILKFNVRSAQVGAHGLPITLDKTGKLIEIRRVQLGPTGKALIPDQSGKLIEFASVKVNDRGRPIFLDKSEKAINSKLGPNGNPIMLDKAGKPIEVASMKFGGAALTFLDSLGDVIGIEEGQAGGNGVLMAQNGSLVYYAIFVNDVYASFLTGTKNHGIIPAPSQFPTTMTDLAKITTFNGGKAFPDANALAVEIKTAWVETTGLDTSKYITMSAVIPTYDQSNPAQWTPNGSKSTQLALVGMHVVGSTQGHPEMIWATFEHAGNTPNAAYTYDSAGGTKTVAQDTSGTWLFCATNSAGPFNTERMEMSGNNIVPRPGQSIGPSDTMRWKAWGAATDQDPNPIALHTSGSNSEIITMNNSVLGMLLPGDIRKNYIFTSSTWTFDGAAPRGAFGDGGNEVGTNKMSNTTMETYQQGFNGTKVGTNCFSCHNGNMLGDQFGNGLSHIFGTIKPLP